MTGILGGMPEQALKGCGMGKITCLKLMVDYQSYPLWNTSGEGYGDVDPDSLPLSAELKQALLAWAEEYDDTLDMDDPPRSGFASPKALDAFLEQGAGLYRRLQDELGAGIEITYMPMGGLKE